METPEIRGTNLPSNWQHFVLLVSCRVTGLQAKR